MSCVIEPAPALPWGQACWHECIMCVHHNLCDSNVSELRGGLDLTVREPEVVVKYREIRALYIFGLEAHFVGDFVWTPDPNPVKRRGFAHVARYTASRLGSDRCGCSAGIACGSIEAAMTRSRGAGVTSYSAGFTYGSIELRHLMSCALVTSITSWFCPKYLNRATCSLPVQLASLRTQSFRRPVSHGRYCLRCLCRPC